MDKIAQSGNINTEYLRNYQVDIEHLKVAGIYVVTDRKSGLVYTSSDLRDYKSIETSARISSIAAVSTDPESVLLIGSDKIYALSPNCGSE